MNLSTIINTLSVEEKRQFLGFLKQRTRRGDHKNARLFKLIDQGKIHNLDVELYGKPARNAYHALCKRLQDSLIDFVAARSFQTETSEEMDVMKQLLASRIFFEHKQFKTAFRTLEKAERKAIAHDLYSILNEIYHTKIQYGHLHPKQSLDEIIDLSNKNLELYQRELRLNMAYATIKQRIQEGERAVDIIISETFQSFDIDVDTNLTYKSLFQLMKILTTAAQLRSDYYTIVPFTETIYNTVSTKRAVAHKHLYYHIEILNLMAMVSFRNKDFPRSIEFSQLMEGEMKKKNHAFHNRFAEALILLKALNANFTGNAREAISMLESFSKHSPKTILTLIMCQFQQQQFREAYQLMKRLQHSDKFYEKKEGFIWVLQKNIIELLLLIELDKLDLFWTRMQRFKRSFFPKLRSVKEERAIRFVKLMDVYYDQPEIAGSSSFKQKVEETFEWKDTKQEDIFVMSFYAWLKSKMDKSDIYETTLDLVNRR